VKRLKRLAPRKPLAVKALYSVNALARAAGIGHRPLQRVLAVMDVRVVRVGRFLFVPLTELEEKFPPLWESIRTAETLRAFDDAR
jgi:hypothetical protein